MALLANHATMAPHRQVHMRMQASLPGMAGMAGMPGLAWEDPLSYPFSASAPAKFGGHPGSTSNAYLAQARPLSSTTILDSHRADLL